MPRYYEPPDDDDEDYLADGEDPEPEAADDGTAPCPHCGKDKYEESERCPHCGNYVSEEDNPSPPPMWIIVTAIICLVVVGFWVLSR
jgi:uncharacterized protein (DUF983 family)